MSGNTIRVTATPWPNGDIVLEREFHGVMDDLVRRVLKTEEGVTRAALKSLGWASPEEVAAMKNEIQRLTTHTTGAPRSQGG